MRNYLSALPMHRQTYVAEKYIFTAITAYVWFSVYMIWHIVFSAFAAEGFALNDYSDLVAGMALPMFCFALLQAALNMPLGLLLGREKTKLILTGIVMTICMLILGFVLFGNVEALAKMNLYAAIIGKALYAGKIDLKQAIAAAGAGAEKGEIT